MRGGKIYVRSNNVVWPDRDGCEDKEPLPVTVKRGTFIDRYGPTSGFFVSPINKIPYSYSERSLPWLGQKKNNNNDKNETRKGYYRIEYGETSPDDDNYHVYSVLKDIDALACRTAPAYNYPGGAIQYRLLKSIDELTADGSLEEVTTPFVPHF